MLAALTLAAGPSDLAGQATTVFRGAPEVKVTEGGVERSVEAVSAEAGGSLMAVVSRIGDRYYWASRENTELVRIQSGAFITYIALNGSGFIRVVAPGQKEIVSIMGPTEERFDYVEHLMIGLRSITYFGITRALER